MPTSPDAHACPRERIAWLLAALGAILAVVFMQSAPCHDAIVACGNQTVCAQLISGFDHAEIAAAEGFDAAADLAEAGVAAGFFVGDIATAVPVPEDPAGVLGLCAAMLLALLAAGAALIRARSLRHVGAPGIEPVSVLVTTARPVAPSLAILCVLRT